MDYYNQIPGPSSRPYDPNSYSNPSGSSTTPSTQSPQFPSYPMMTDLDLHYNNNNNNNVDLDDDDHQGGHGSGGGGVQVDNTAPLVEPHQDLDSFLETFWTRQMAVVERDNPDFKTYPLPLARIKKVMKSDEDVKMISAEVPIMFSKACEIFISELTCRAWLIAETNKRRTLQKADVANAIAASDMFDFLIDIIPRDDGSGSASGSGAAGTGQIGTGAGVGAAPGAGGVEVVDEEEVDEDDDERVFTEFVRQEEIG